MIGRSAALLVAALVAAVSGCNVTLRFGDADAAVGNAPCNAGQSCPLPSLFCDPSSGQCVACVSDGNCGSADRPRCDVALHVCVECGATQDCAAGWLCEPNTRTCVEACTSSGSCRDAAPTCDTTRGICASCSGNASCDGNAKPYCDPSTDRCVACVTDQNCRFADLHCDRTTGRCVGCLSSSDCPPPQLCDPASSDCTWP